MNESTPQAIRLRLQAVVLFHRATLRGADEGLLQAMAEYGQTISSSQERQAA